MFNIKAARVDTSAVESRVREFVKVLSMTRCCTKFPCWKRSTVDKAFQWADHVKVYAASADDVQKRAIMAGIGETGVGFVDRDPLQVLDRPVETLLRAIMGSPILSWVALSTQVVSRTLESASSRIGQDSTVALVAAVFEATMADRLKANASRGFSVAGVGGGVGGGGGGGTNLTATRPYQPAPEQVAMALEILLQCCERDGVPLGMDSPVEIIKQAAGSDLFMLRNLCLALTLTPATIACGLGAFARTSPGLTCSASHQQLQQPQPQSQPQPQPQTQPQPLAQQQQQQQQPDTDWERVYQEAQNPSLWSIVLGALQAAPTLLLHRLGDSDDPCDFRLVMALCSKNAQVDQLFHDTLRAALGSDETQHSPEARKRLMNAINAYIYHGGATAPSKYTELEEMLAVLQQTTHTSAAW